MDTQANRIEVNAEVMQGKPVIRRTRITVELLLRKLAEGAKTEDLLDAYPRLVVEDTVTFPDGRVTREAELTNHSRSFKILHKYAKLETG